VLSLFVENSPSDRTNVSVSETLEMHYDSIGVTSEHFVSNQLLTNSTTAIHRDVDPLGFQSCQLKVKEARGLEEICLQKGVETEGEGEEIYLTLHSQRLVFCQVFNYLTVS
jgi:hypothetical protein